MKYLNRTLPTVFLLLSCAFAHPDGLDRGQDKNKPDPPRAERDKPVLIREPEKPEKAENAPEIQTPAQPDPALAEKNFDVGTYYFKRKRYDAAIDRYKEAIRFKPNYFEAYKWLAKAYEKKKDFASALNTYEQYVQKFADADEFKREIQRLQEQAKKR